MGQGVVVPPAVSRIAGSKVELTEAGETVTPKPEASLSPAQVERAVAARVQVLQDDIFGSAGTEEARAERWQARVAQLSDSAPHDREIGEYLRLARGPSRFEGSWDPHTGKVHLSERPVPAVDVSASGVTGRRELERIFPKSGLDPRQRSAILEAWRQQLPAPVRELLEPTGTQVEVVDGTEPPASFREIFGPLAETIHARHWVEGASGLYNAHLGRVLLHASNATPAFLATRATHELMHAVDWTMGSGGKQYSSSAEWQWMFDLTKNHPQAERLFPTICSQKDPSEFFAECATVFLGTHVTHYGDVVTRDDLRENHPQLHDLLAEIFQERIPRAVAEKRGQAPQGLAAHAVEEARVRYREEPSAEALEGLAWRLAEQGLVSRDASLLDEAIELLASHPEQQGLCAQIEGARKWLASSRVEWK